MNPAIPHFRFLATFLAITLLSAPFAWSQTLPAALENFRVTDYGVSALDSSLLQTGALQRVIDLGASAVAAGNTTTANIVVPKGVFLTGALFFKPGTRLVLESGAVIKGSDIIKDYPLIPSRMEGRSIMYYAALINAYFVDGFSITGRGMINGNGRRFWEGFWLKRTEAKKTGHALTGLEIARPRLVFIWGCHGVKLDGVHFENAGYWTTHFYKSSNIVIQNCQMTAPWKPVPAPSSDGIDLDACKNVLIKNCYISVNDDGIAIKGGKGPLADKEDQNGPVENVLIDSCRFGPVHAALTMGSECIHAKNIVMNNCLMDMDRPLLNLKMRPDTYQVYENILIHHITGRVGSVIRMAPWRQYYNMEAALKDSTLHPHGTVANIVFSDISVSCNNFGLMQGNPLDTVRGVVFKDMDIKVTDSAALVALKLLAADSKDSIKAGNLPATVFKNKYQKNSEVEFRNVSVNGKGIN